MPGLIYLSDPKAIPDSWNTYTTTSFSFRYPSQLQPVEFSFQRIAFYENDNEKAKGKACFAERGVFLNDMCPVPVYVMYYRSDPLDLESVSYDSAAALYALDNREWLVTPPDNPVGAEIINAITTTSKRAIRFTIIKYDETKFTTESGMFGDNYRDEIYKIFSTFVIKDDSHIISTGISQKNKKAFKIQIILKKGLEDNYDSKTTGLDHAAGLDWTQYPVRMSKELVINYVYKIGGNDPYKDGSNEFEFYTTFSADYLKPGEYTYRGNKFIVSEVDPSQIEYIENRKYCQQDSDCSYRSNFCELGFYNSYQGYYPVWGCGMGIYEDGKETYDFEKNCEREMLYERVSCVNNRCSGINVRYQCEKQD